MKKRRRRLSKYLGIFPSFLVFCLLLRSTPLLFNSLVMDHCCPSLNEIVEESIEALRVGRAWTIETFNVILCNFKWLEFYIWKSWALDIPFSFLSCTSNRLKYIICLSLIIWVCYEFYQSVYWLVFSIHSPLSIASTPQTCLLLKNELCLNIILKILITRLVFFKVE